VGGRKVERQPPDRATHLRLFEALVKVSAEAWERYGSRRPLVRGPAPQASPLAALPPSLSPASRRVMERLGSWVARVREVVRPASPPPTTTTSL